MSMNRNLIQVYYGDGKGKTTAAIGLMVRAVGQGMKVLLLQFFKKNMTGELIALQYLPGVRCFQFGTGKFLINRELEEEDRREFLMGWQLAQQALSSGEYDLLILDELTYAFSCQLLTWGDFRKVMETRSEQTEVVVTGRAVLPELIEYADLVSEIVMVKHPFQKGIPARKGIEF